MSEEIDARFLRSMLYEPLPGSAAVILVQLGIIEDGQIEALGQRTYDAECGRLSLALDDGRTVELERAMHLQSEDGYAVRIRSRAGQTISRSFIHIDRNLGVRNLHNDRLVYIDDADYEAAPDFSHLDTAESEARVAQTEPATQDPLETEPVAEEFPTAPSIYTAEDVPAEELDAPPSDAAPFTPVPSLSETISAESEPEPLVAEPEFQPMPLSVEAATRLDLPEMHPGHEAAPTEPLPESLHVQQPPDAATPSAEPELPALSEPVAEPTPELHLEAPVEPAAEVSEPTEPVPEPPAVSAEQPLAAAPEELTLSEEPSEAATPEPAEASSDPALETHPATPSTPEALREPEPPTEPLTEPQDPRFLPLQDSLAPADAALFDFIAQTGTVHTYEHRETFRYIHIDASSGLFYDQTRTPISRSAALRHALTPRVAILSAAVPGPETNLQASAEPTPPPPTPPTEPELRTRSQSLTNGHARAAIKPDPDPAVPATPDAGLSFDAFTRKRAQFERDSWRDRIAGISRALRRNRTPRDESSS